jgi:hypothetical protein
MKAKETAKFLAAIGSLLKAAAHPQITIALKAVNMVLRAIFSRNVATSICNHIWIP